MTASKKQQNTAKANSLLGMVAFDSDSMQIVEVVSAKVSKKGNVTIQAKADNGEKVTLHNKGLNLHWVSADQRNVAEQEKSDFYDSFFTSGTRAKFEKAKRRIGSLAFDSRIPGIVEIVDAKINGKKQITIVVKNENGSLKQTPETYLGGKWLPASQRAVVEQQKADYHDYQDELLRQKKAAFLQKKEELEEKLSALLKYRDFVTDEGDVLADAQLHADAEKLNAYILLTIETRDGEIIERGIKWFQKHTWMTRSDYGSRCADHNRAIDDLWQGMQSAKGTGIDLLPQKYRQYFKRQCEQADLDLMVSEYDKYAWNNHREVLLLESDISKRLLKHRKASDPKQAVLQNFEKYFAVYDCGFDNYVSGSAFERLYLLIDDDLIIGLDGDDNDLDRLSGFLVSNLDDDSLLYLLKNTFGSKANLEEQFSTIKNPKEALAAIIQGLGGDYGFRVPSELSENLIMNTDWLDGQLYELTFPLLKVEDDVAEELIPQVFEEKYLPELAEEYAEINNGFADEKANAKAKWDNQIAEYNQSNENDLEQKMFAALSAMTVLNHVAKTLQNYRGNSSDFEYDMLKDSYQSAESIYDLKNELLKAMYDKHPEYVKLSAFVPEDPDKIDVTFCDTHLDFFREERSYLGLTPMEFYFENKEAIDRCRNCGVTYHVNYYSMYSFEIVLPNAEFDFHEPYPIGRFDFPKLATLPKADQEVNDEGMFLFGREADFSESCLALAIDLTEPIKAFVNGD